MSVALPDNFDLLRRTATGPDVFTSIPGVVSFDEGNIAAEQIDTTDFDSAGNRREFEAGLIDASEGSFVVNYEPGDTQHEFLRSAVGGAAVRFKAVNGTRTMIFDALVLGCSKPVAVGQKREMTVTIKLTGNPTES